MKILVVVEGKVTESKFFTCLFDKFGIQAEIVVASTNLYSLYDKMQSYNFECDVKDVLKEIISSDEVCFELNQKFAYTYLIFDSDLHHKAPSQRNEDVMIKSLADGNFQKLKTMASYFTDETDPSVGRLYINYPMMESYRYLNNFSDKEYLNSEISINEMASFKSFASQKGLSGIDIKKYTKNNFINLIQLNVEKLAIISDEVGIPTYDKYQQLSSSDKIVAIQYNLANELQKLNVLNTSLFIILDYYGNRDNFYDSIMLS